MSQQPAPGRMPTICLPGVEAYAEAHTTPEPPHLRALAADTIEASRNAQMMVGPLEGRFLELLVHMVRPRRVLEIGTFTGYSALSMAAALPEGATITTLEINSKHEAIARKHIDASPYAGRIEVVMGPALESLAKLDGPFDLVFIDADKGNQLAYYEAALARLSPHGVIAVDNTIWSGRVVDESVQDDDTKAVRAFNDFVASDPRVIAVLCTVRDGVTLIRKA